FKGAELSHPIAPPKSGKRPSLCEAAAVLAMNTARLCQYGHGSPAQEARHPEAHHHRAHRTHVRRSAGTLCRGTVLRRHNGQGRDCGLFGRSDARRARRQHPELRQCRRYHQRTRRVDIFARRSECAEARRRIVTKSSMPLRIVEKTPAYWGVLFDNPPLNVVDSSVFEGLQELLSRMDASPDLRVVVFESANPEFYLAHYDMTGKSASVARTLGPSGLPIPTDAFVRLTKSPVVSIAKIRGRVRGVGSEFVLACDMRFASREKAVLGQPEVGVGVIPGGGGT